MWISRYARAQKKVRYDNEVDPALIRFSPERSVRGVELKEGVILHVKDEIVSLEILDASARFRER